MKKGLTLIVLALCLFCFSSCYVKGMSIQIANYYDECSEDIEEITDEIHEQKISTILKSPFLRSLYADRKGFLVLDGVLFAYLGDDTDVVLPKKVQRISSWAFYGRTDLTSITIPDSVTSIGDYAFDGCSGLTSMTIQDSVTSIGEGAFYGCTGLTSITIPDSVTSIGEGAFYGCTGMTSITVASGNTKYHSVGNCLIETESKTLILGCKNSVIPTDGSVTSIGDYAFYGCTGLTSVTIPDSVTSIDYEAFYYCTGLTSITIPDSVTSIGNWAFSGCYKLIEVCNQSPTLTVTAGDSSNGYIGDYAKHIITDEKDSYLSTTQDGYIFYEDGTHSYLMGYLGSNTNLILPATSLTGKNYEIYQYAFYKCTGLTSVTIPNSVTSIGNYAFFGCSGLTAVSFNGAKAQWNAISKGNHWNQYYDNVYGYKNISFTVTCTDGTLVIDGNFTNASDKARLETIFASLPCCERET